MQQYHDDEISALVAQIIAEKQAKERNPTMVSTDRITIDTSKQWSAPVAIFVQACFWTFMVLAEGISHKWFGGSWVIDILVLAGLGIFIAGWVRRNEGYMVTMRTEEIRRWLDAGAPKDIKAWRASLKT